MEGGEVPIHHITSKERRDLVVAPLVERELDMQEIYTKTTIMEKMIEVDDNKQLAKALEEVITHPKIKVYDLISPDGMTLLHLCTQKNAQKCFNLVLIQVKMHYGACNS